MARSSRISKTAAKADRHALELARKLGRILRDARQRAELTQREAAKRAGITQSTWSRLELASDARYSLATLDRAGMAVDAPLDAFFRRSSAADKPRDYVHLGGQNTVIATATPGGWRSLPEHPIGRIVQSSRSADVLLQRGFEYALADIWDWFDDVGGAERAWHRRLDAVERYAISRMAGEDALPNVSGVWVVRATVRNRQMVTDTATSSRLHSGVPEKPGSTLSNDRLRPCPKTPRCSGSASKATDSSHRGSGRDQATVR